MKTLRDFKYVFQMQLFRSSGKLVFIALLQILMSLGVLCGFTYFFDSPDSKSILYLATGAPTLILILTGLVILPQQIGIAKSEGYVEFMRTWPVKRSLILCADSVTWLIITVPGIVVATVVAHSYFAPGYQLFWTIIPSVLLIALTSIGTGYGIAYLLPADISLAITQVIAFGSLMFSPINFPMERLPEWLQYLHRILPIYSMAQVMRASLAASTFTASTGNYIKLIIWCVLGYGWAMFILNRK